nr:PEP-CTERM sorting domain-containing protein [Pseudomonadales bacterium]
MKSTLFAFALATAASPAFAAACVNGLLSSLTTCEMSTGAGGAFQLSNWTLNNPSLTGYNLTSGAFTASEVSVSFSTTATSLSVSFRDNRFGTPGFNPFAADSTGNVNQQAQFTTGFFITPLTSGPDGTINSVGLAVTDISDNGVPLGSLTVQKIYAGGNVIDPAMTISEVTGGASDPSLFQPNTTGSSTLSVVDVVTLSARNGGAIAFEAYTNTFTTGRVANDVPEPATFGILGLGLAGLASFRRRR